MPAKYQLAEIERDITAAKAAARHHGFAWNDTETVEGAVRNILAVLLAERQLHEKEIQKLREKIEILEKKGEKT